MTPRCDRYPLPYTPDPTALFDRIQAEASAVLLDSGQPGTRRGRYDIMSAWPVDTLQIGETETADAFFSRLRAALARLGPAQAPDARSLPFAGGLIGYLSYDFGRRLERLPAQALDDIDLPQTRFGLYTWAVINDHADACSYLVFHPSLLQAERQRLTTLFETCCEPSALEPFRLAGAFESTLSASNYQAGIERVHAYITAGDCYQVNYTQRFQAPCHGAPWHAYRALRTACPTPFSGYMPVEGGAILSHSPERFMRLSNGAVETRPIKGTRPRHADPHEDAAQADALLRSPKDRAENLMIVDLLRNDLGRSCQIGSVRVPELFALESYPNVHHLVSSVTGRLETGRDALDLLAGSFPGGSITGAPKIRAMEIIDELEPARRTLYCGSLLYIDVRGEMDSSIAIRTVLIKDGTAYCWGGGGIVMDSHWEEEYVESITKVRVLMETLERL